jgi:hypothetical protein
MGFRKVSTTYHNISPDQAFLLFNIFKAMELQLDVEQYCRQKRLTLMPTIALHSSIVIASRKPPEIALVHLGAFGFGLRNLQVRTIARGRA